MTVTTATKTTTRRTKTAKPVAIETIRKPSAAAIRRDAIASRAAYAPLAVWSAGLALSLAHQAHGVAISTTVQPWEGWATAIMIDAGFVCAKALPYLTRSEAERAALGRYLTPVSYAALALCGWFNAVGFAGYHPTEPVRVATSIVLAAFVPAIMVAMSNAFRILRLGK